MFQDVKFGLKYAFELIVNAKTLADSLRTVSPNQKVSDYLATNRIYPSSAMGLLGLMFYDMAVGDERVSQERKLVGQTASRIILFADIVDNILDQRPTSLDDKLRFLDRARSNLFGHSTNKSEDSQEEASYSLARAIYSGFLVRDKDGKVEKISDELAKAVKQQFTETDADELLRIAKTIGSCCTDTAAVLTEIVTGREYPSIRESARKMGEYCELLDNCYELYEDLAEGVNTYPTVRVRQEGNSHKLRREIKGKMLALAEESILEGFSCLTTQKQKTIYRVLLGMIDLKYKVVGRLHLA